MGLSGDSYTKFVKLIIMELLVFFTLWDISINREVQPLPIASLNCKNCVGLRNKTTNSITEWYCPDCDPGMGLTVACVGIYDTGTVIGCVKCVEGKTFSDKRDIGQCIPCRRCTKTEDQIGKCSADKDNVECRCKSGFYRDEGSKDCKPCSWCCKGKINHVIKECKKFHRLPLEKHCSFQDAKKCNPSHANPTNSTDISRQLGSVSSVPNTSNRVTKKADTQEVEDVPKDKVNTHKDAPTHESVSLTKSILIGVCFFFVGIFGIGIVTYRTRRQRSTNVSCQSNIQSQEEAVPLQTITSPQTSVSGIEERDTLLQHDQLRQQPEQEQQREQLQQHAATQETANGISISQSQYSSQDPHSADSVDEREKKKEVIRVAHGPLVENMLHDVKHEVGLRLNVKDNINGNDFRRVAQEIKLDEWKVKNLPNENPMEGVFDVMITRFCTTLDEFVDILYRIDRVDVVNKMYEMAVKRLEMNQNELDGL